MENGADVLSSIGYMVDNGVVYLTRITRRVVCEQCEEILALGNRGTMMIKTDISVLEGNNLILRCRKCRAMVQIKIEDNGVKIVV